MKKNRAKLILAALLVTATLLSACGQNSNEGVTETKKTSTSDKSGNDNTKGIEFSSQDLNGNSVNQEIFKEAKVTMINIWGTFCGPCISEMPDLGEIHKEYAEKGFQIVGIISDVKVSNDDTALDIIAQTGADYTHIITSEDLYNGLLRNVQVVPTTIFVDSQGKQIGDAYAGAKSKEDWKKIIDEKLSEVGA